MSSTSKLIAIVVVLFVLLAGGLWLMKSKGGNVPVDSSAIGKTSAPTDISDAGLDQDITAVDASLNALTNDTAAIDAGLNDAPIQQTE